MKRAQIKSPVRMVMTSMFLSLLVIAGAILVTSRDCSDVGGSLTASGGEAGGPEITFTPVSCRSGQREGFFGVALGDGAGGKVVLVGRAKDGQSVKITPPGGGSELLLRPEDCQVFELLVRDTETEVQGITWREGRLRLECSRKEGGKVEAQLTFSACG